MEMGSSRRTKTGMTSVLCRNKHRCKDAFLQIRIKSTVSEKVDAEFVNLG